MNLFMAGPDGEIKQGGSDGIERRKKLVNDAAASDPSIDPAELSDAIDYAICAGSANIF